MNWNLSRLRLAAWLCALFTVVVGAKLWIVQIYATPIPFWDQWDEARLLFKPWLDGDLTWGALFAPHNEHRIFFTRVLDLAELRLNGQWDPILQMVINALIHAGYACGLACCLWIFTGRKNEGPICFLLALFFALPYAAENTVHGFQSQFYFLSIFSVATIVGLGFYPPGSRRWCCGLAAGIMSIFTMGSGLLASLAVAGLAILRMLKERGVARNHLVTLGCSLMIFIFGLMLNATTEQDKQFQATSLMVFLNALMGNLGWPFSGQPAMCFFVCLPLAITAAAYFSPGFKNPREAEFILVLGFWGFLQSAALAYGRATLENSSRYMDILNIVPIAGFAGLFILRENVEFNFLPRRTAIIVAGGWAVILFFGLVEISWMTTDNYLPESRKWGLIEMENVRAFVATDDPSHLLNKPALEIPYWNTARLIDLLRDPKLAAILPPGCHAPLKLEKNETSFALRLLNHSPDILLAGLCLCILLAGLDARRILNR